MSPADSLRYRWLDAIVGKEGQVGPLGSSVRHAAVTLAAFMDDAGRCYPGIDVIAAAMDRHRATTIRSLNELERQGWIERERGTFGKPTIYRATFPQSRTGATRAPVASSASQSRKQSLSESQTAPPQSRTGATRTLQERSIEHSKENALPNVTAKKGDSALQYPFTTEVSEAFIRTRGRRLEAEDFPMLKAVALELKATYPEETIVEAVRTLGRSADPPESLPAYVEAVAA